MIYLSIVIPLYNEEKRIPESIEKLGSYFKNQKYSYEIIFVNDGSSDNTVSKINSEISKQKNLKNIRIIDNKKNHGKGYVIRQGIMNSFGKYVLFTDVDLSTPIEEVEKLFPYIEKYPVIIGSRYLKKDSIKIAQPLSRRIISRAGNLFVKTFLGFPYKDTQCGFKLFESNASKDIFKRSTINRWGFDMEILAIAKLLGYKVKEVPVNWYDDPRSQVRAGRAAANTIKEVIKIKDNIKKGVYNNENYTK
jgi:glycosyltransferase involved in cell wall biosynthesis